MSRLILVTGCHRSGTSAITRSLQALGVGLGSQLLGPIAGDNDKGFYEDTDIQALNNMVLSAMGRRWDTVDDMPAWQPTREVLDYALMLVASKVGEQQNYAFKDPRMSRLMPFWTRVLAERGGLVGCVIALRNPLSVAYSLRQRNGIAIEDGLRLWLAHTGEAITQAPPHWRKIVVDYDALMALPLPELTRLARCFGLTLPTDGGVEDYLDGFLDHKLQHGRFGDAALEDYEAAVPGLCEGYRVARELAK